MNMLYMAIESERCKIVLRHRVFLSVDAKLSVQR